MPKKDSHSHNRSESQSSYYFVKQNNAVGSGAGPQQPLQVVAATGEPLQVVTPRSGEVLLESLPAGSDVDRYAPRPVNLDSPRPTSASRKQFPGDDPLQSSSSSSLPQYNPVNQPFGMSLFNFFGASRSRIQTQQRSSTSRTRTKPKPHRMAKLTSALRSKSFLASATPLQTNILQRGAKKVDPKVYFSVERTFLAWMHAAVLLAGMSVAIGAYAEPGSRVDVYAALLIPVAIVCVVHAMAQYGKRSYLIAIRASGPYEDRWGPVVIGCIFVTAMMVEFLLLFLGGSSSANIPLP